MLDVGDVLAEAGEIRAIIARTHLYGLQEEAAVRHRGFVRRLLQQLQRLPVAAASSAEYANFSFAKARHRYLQNVGKASFMSMRHAEHVVGKLVTITRGEAGSLAVS